MTNYDVIKRLIGPVSPTGCHSTDTDRLKNLKEMCSVVDQLLSDIDDVTVGNLDSSEQSVKDMVHVAQEFYLNI